MKQRLLLLQQQRRPSQHTACLHFASLQPWKYTDLQPRFQPGCRHPGTSARSGERLPLAGTLDTYYYLLQHLYSTTGLIKKNGTLVEGYAYNTYGQVGLWSYPDFDFDRDGDAESDDYDYMFLALEFFPNDPTIDGDMDGDADFDDLAMFVTIPAASDIPTELYVSEVGNRYFFTGRRLHMVENVLINYFPPNRQLQNNRARHYDADHGRWLQRDPAGYVDGMNLYEYVSSRPTNRVDPSGSKTVPCKPPGLRASMPPFSDWVPSWKPSTDTVVMDEGGFNVFANHWIGGAGTNILFPAGSSYSQWLDSTATIMQMKLDIGDKIKQEALGNARRLRCGEWGSTCLVQELSRPFLESPGGYYGTDWLSTGNIHIATYTICRINKACCIDWRRCTRGHAICRSRFVAYDDFHFGFPGTRFAWHAQLEAPFLRGTEYYGPGCP